MMDIKQASVRELVEEILSRGEDVAIEPFPHTFHHNEDTYFTVMLNETLGMEFKYPARIIGIYANNEKYEPLSNP